MTKDEIIEMARHAGYLDLSPTARGMELKELEAFAKLVAAKEREECCESIDEIDDGEAPEYRACQEAIRARGSK